MFATLSSAAYWQFSVIAGLGAMIVFDLWCALTRAMGIIIVDWSLMGRWLFSKLRRHRSLCDDCQLQALSARPRPAGFARNLYCIARHCDYTFRPKRSEMLLGWGLHYLLGIFVAGLVPLIGGMKTLRHPALAPILLVGFCLPSVLCQIVTLPSLRRLYGRKRTPQQCQLHALALVGNGLFALALYSLMQSGLPAVDTFLSDL